MSIKKFRWRQEYFADVSQFSSNLEKGNKLWIFYSFWFGDQESRKYKFSFGELKDRSPYHRKRTEAFYTTSILNQKSQTDQRCCLLYVGLPQTGLPQGSSSKWQSRLLLCLCSLYHKLLAFLRSIHFVFF